MIYPQYQVLANAQRALPKTVPIAAPIIVNNMPDYWHNLGD